MQQFLVFLADHWPEIALALSLVVQFTPIKINPWTTLFKWVGRLINAELKEEIAELKKALKEQDKSIDENEKDRIRYEVLEFANSCRHGRKHTKDEFQHIIVLNTKYHRLLEKTDDENGVFDEEYKYILELYEMCQRENKFL